MTSVSGQRAEEVTREDLTFMVDLSDSDAISITEGVIYQRQSEVGSTVFKTISDVIRCLPRVILHTVTINVAAQTEDGLSISGYLGGGTIKVVGTWATPSALSAAQAAGTAQAGTTTTSVALETAVSANAVQKKFIGITVSGTETIRPIIDHTTSAATIHAVAALSSGNTYRFLEPATALSAVTVSSCQPTVQIHNCTITAMVAQSASSILVQNCEFDSSASDGSFDADFGDFYQIESCLVHSGASIDIRKCHQANVRDTFISDGALRIASVALAKVGVEAHDCTSRAVLLDSILKALLSFRAEDCTATQLEIASVLVTELDGVGLSGADNSGDYLFSISGNSFFDITDYTGNGGNTSLMEVDGQTFSTAPNTGVASVWRATVVTSGSAYGLDMKNTYLTTGGNIEVGNALFYENDRVDGALITAAGTTQADAAALGNNYSVISAGTGGVKFAVDPVAPANGSGAMWRMEIYNNSGSAITLYPNNASHTINGTSGGTGISLTNGKVYHVRCNSATDWFVYQANP